ncbi:hypothetical protein BH23ACI1_BH23ACI1_11930 [soil metagenome]
MPAAVRRREPGIVTLDSAPTRQAPSRLALACVVAATAVMAWLSQGTQAFTSADASRVALLPLSTDAIILALAAGAGAFLLVRRGGRATPCLLLALLVLPWVPAALPPVFQFWSHSLGLLVWIAVVLVAIAPGSDMLRALPRSPLAAGGCALIVFAVAAWQVSPSIPGGDEPHYLVITQSLLTDGDLKIENNHARGDYLAYYRGPLQPDYRVRGRDGEIYSIHAPGVSVLVAPAFALAGYPGAVIFLVILAAAGSALAWRLAYRVTARAEAAWFGWAAVTLSTTSVFHSFTVYPDAPGGLLALTGVWALLRARDEAASGEEGTRPWLLHGAALAVLPWMHTRFALIAGGMGALILWRMATTRNAAGKAVAFLAVPAASALGWVAYFVAIYGTPDPSAPYGAESGSFTHVPGGFVGLLLDQRFGLLAYAPVLILAFGGLWTMMVRREHRRLAFEYLFVLVPYLLVVTHFAMWWGGQSAPARFVVPVLPMLTIPAALGWLAIRERATRATIWAALAFTIFATAVLVFVDGGRLAYNARDGYAAWLEWLNPSLDLGRSLPAFWRGREGELYRDAAIWCVGLAAAWGVLRSLQRAPWARSRAVFGTLTVMVLVAAGMSIVPIVWRANAADVTTRTPGQLELLRRVGEESRIVTFDPASYRRLAPGDVAQMLRLHPPRATAQGGAGRDDRPLYILPNVPAGRYRLTLQGQGGGRVMIGIGRDQFALHTEQVGTSPGPLVVEFPVAVRAIIVRGDDTIRRNVRGMLVEPLSIVRPAERLSPAIARQAVRYAGGAAFFLDEFSYAEPEGFWVAGERASSVVVQPDERTGVAMLLVRNGPVENRVEIEAGKWRERLDMGPGEERSLAVPVTPGRGAGLLTVSSAAGFRPSEVEAGSRDNRYLGVWVTLLGSRQ